MSGGYELLPGGIPTQEIVEQVMKEFGVDEKTAERIIAFINAVALRKMEKWVANFRKLQKQKAGDIYGLTRRLKRGDKTVVNEIEKRILELCVEG